MVNNKIRRGWFVFLHTILIKFPVIGISLVLIISAFVLSIWKATVNDTVEFTVNSTNERCGRGTSECHYVVFTREGDIYDNRDSLLNLKWNSGNIQAILQSGHRYRAEVVGWRIPLFSMNKNIISVEEVPTGT